ncbi:hypothetical protein MSPP1_001991 [Malassezia sp. CBS 17886]|nr:hypothetical protein MSPP1_001991 [Malassezia sp. CBS 17886]
MDVGGHDAHNTQRLAITAARPGRIVTDFPIAQENVNRASTLHGGMISTLVDSVGSLSVASYGWFNTGISTDLNVTFVRPGGLAGGTVQATGEVISMGKTLAYTRVELRDPENGKLLAYGSHTKYVRMASGSPENITFDARGEHVESGALPEDA